MSDKLNFGNRARYIQFRFQDSLRKYQPPPRKKVKLNESAHENGDKKNYQSARDYRLIRLCQTRRIYHATSREKASQYSKKKQAMNESAKKASNHVSDFNCSEHVCSEAEKQKSNTSQFEYEDTIVNSNSALCNNQTFAQSLNWKIQIRQTPIKRQVMNQLHRQSMLNDSQKSQQSAKQIDPQNDWKVKDIDFHIGLVEELHQKIINQYLRMQPADQIEVDKSLQKNTQILQTDNNQNNPGINQPQIAVCSSHVQDCCQNQNLAESKMRDENELQLDQKYLSINLNKIQSETFQKQQIQLNYEQKCQTQMESQPTGRVKIKGTKGECYLSARVIYKLCSSNLSPNKITRTIVRHHPYLENASQLFQMVAQKNIKRSKQYSFNS